MNTKMIPPQFTDPSGVVDTRIKEIFQLLPPVALSERFPATDYTNRLVADTRRRIHRILHGEDDRLLVIAGPCSIHDPRAALDYASRLLDLRRSHGDTLELVMRVYFEKPRTTVGWKGLINDPNLDESHDINDGLRQARRLLSDINEMGVPAATEYLDPITPQYIDEFISWTAIGARTTESQVHRQLASGLSTPVGFKNATDGSVRIAVDAVVAARHEHTFMGLTRYGQPAILHTRGNEDCHIILRGGHIPNYKKTDVDAACEQLSRSSLRPALMIDFSHANSSKQFKKQLEVCENVAGQIAAGDRRIIGVMLESNLVEGRQDLVDPRQLIYGQSITDACLGFDDTIHAVAELADAARARHEHAA